jgi:hypothetical protein
VRRPLKRLLLISMGMVWALLVVRVTIRLLYGSPLATAQIIRQDVPGSPLINQRLGISTLKLNAPDHTEFWRAQKLVE